MEHAQGIREPPQYKHCVVPLEEFTPELMGAKSNNLKNLQSQIPAWMNLPESICLPFKFMQHVLQICDPQGAARIGRLVNRLSKTKKIDKMAGRLLRCKQIVLGLQHERGKNDPFIKELKAKLAEFGITDFAKAWTAIKKVWASKFNERAFLATKKIGVTLDQVYMAVLIQRIVKAEYAYVIHTVNPTNGEENEVYVEACRGLGESLVSDAPGSALSFTTVKDSYI